MAIAGKSKLKSRAALACAVLGGSLLVPWWVLSRQTDDSRESSMRSGPATRLSAGASGELQRAAGRRMDFKTTVADAVRRDGRLTVTVHVALADARLGGAAKRFGDGARPERNLHWGALYGVDTHLGNAAGWRRIWRDGGDGGDILQRSVFRRRAGPTAAWRKLGVEQSFDVYVLACAWPSRAIRRAMERPLREAAGLDETRLPIDGTELSFGAGSAVVGYLGPNALAREYWDWAADIAGGDGTARGVFYLCPHSAYFDPELKKAGAAAVLLARAGLVCEAYTLEGLLEALVQGEIDDGFLRLAAEKYAKYQKGTSPARARAMFYSRLPE